MPHVRVDPPPRQFASGSHAQGWATAQLVDGKTLATGSTDNVMRLWDVKTGKVLSPLKGHKEAVGAVAFSPDGSGESTTPQRCTPSR